MELTRQMIRDNFDAADQRNGENYYRLGRVQQYAESETPDGIHAECVVEGNRRYHVRLLLRTDGLELACDCPRFRNKKSCKHLVAAMLYAMRQEPKQEIDSTDREMRNLLQTYLAMPRAGQDLGQKARLEANLCEIVGGYPLFSFKVGIQKLYVLRDIPAFLNMVDEKRTYTYGKALTLCHELSRFDEPSRQLIYLLMDVIHNYRTTGYGGFYSLSGIYGDKARVQWTGKALDAFFDLQKERQDAGERPNFLVREEDPAVTLSVSAQPGGVRLDLEAAERSHCFGSYEKKYVLIGDTIFRCSDNFGQKAFPLLSAQSRGWRLSQQDIPTLCSCVLPQLADTVTVEDPDGVLQRFTPDECRPCYYFELQSALGLVVQVVFLYGGRRVHPKTPPQETKEIKRDIRAEQDALQPLQRWLKPVNNGDTFYLPDEGEMIEFLSSHLDDFHAYGEVFVSEQLRKKRVNSSRASVGISVADGLLNLDIDTGEFPRQELEALYQGLLHKQKYYKLRDGRYLMLDGSPVEKIAEIAHMTRLDEKTLAAGKATMPAFRALYLDKALEGQEGLTVHRDKSYRTMIRDFRSVAESDYAPPKALDACLRGYQRVGFQWMKTLESNGFGGVLADEMGLGKTIQVLAFLATVPRAEKGQPSLVVCPASLVMNWGDELTKFAPFLKANLILGTAAHRREQITDDKDSDVWVTSYDLLKRDVDLYEKQAFYCCVLDEGQNIKNQSTVASRAVKQINCRQRFVLTGTPIENRLSELWNMFDFLMPGYLFSRAAFVEKLEKPIVRSGDPQARRQFRLLVQPFVLRRLKQDVLKELPPKIEHVRKISQSEAERKTYLAAAAAAKQEFADGAQEPDKIRILAALTRLRRICCDPHLCFSNYEGESGKLEACLELCAGMAANGHQILIFSQFTTMLDELREGLDRLQISNFTLQGSTPTEQRARLVKAFNKGEATVFLISLKAGGTGLNLTAADVVIHYDPWWNQAAQDQATDRAHRIGQKACVQVYKLIVKDTIEEKILELQQRKAALMENLDPDDADAQQEQGVLSLNRQELLALLD